MLVLQKKQDTDNTRTTGDKPMPRLQPALSYILLAFLMFTISACASSYYQNSGFDKDPISYLAGEWEGSLYHTYSRLVSDRFLTIYQQASGSTLNANYGIPGTDMQGLTTVSVVRQSSGEIKVTFRTGSGSTVNLWLARMGDDWVLDGTIKSDSPAKRMLLKKVR